MALQGSGQISLANLQTEFGGTNPISISEYYRDGAYVTSNNTVVPASGVISLSKFYNTTAQFTFTNSTNYSTAQDLRTLALNAGWDGTDYLVVINNGIFSSNNTGQYPLTISGSFPNGVALINNYYIVGMGGQGGSYGQPGLPAGHGLLVQTAVTITNNGVIAGGGGGGSGSPPLGWDGIVISTSGGGGASGLTPALGGPSAGVRTGDGYPSSWGGILYNIPGSSKQDGTGGVVNSPSGVGGTWGNAGGNTYAGGGAGGYSVVGNSYVTWVATGTRYGALV